MSDDLQHLAVKLDLPYYPRNASAYDRARADAIIGPYIDRDMVPALEASGPPAERLAAMAAAVHEARVAVAKDERVPSFDFNGLNPVEIDLRLALVQQLSLAIAQADRPKAERKVALKGLITVIKAGAPVGIPKQSNPRQHWLLDARDTAIDLVKEQIEDL